MMAVLAVYPAFVLGTVFASTLRSDLPGGRNGPKDAYRHTLASATVAYTGSPQRVEWVTRIMEHGDGGDAANAMDRHNNRIGERIGMHARSWHEMRHQVRVAIATGAVDAVGDDQVRWLPPDTWRDRAF